MLPSYRNQSIDLQSSQLTCFYMSGSIGCYWFNSYDGGPYHIETSPLICRANQWTDLYMIGTSVMKGLNPLGILKLQLEDL